MIADDIKRVTIQLDDIEDRFKKLPTGSYDASVFALAYLLVLSSWIEECRNILCCQLVDAFFVPSENTDKLKKEVQRINGFKFSDHFKRAIVKTIGEHGYFEIRSACDAQILESLESSLGSIWSARCDAAHKTFEGLQNQNFMAPSMIKMQRDRVFAGLIELERSIRSLQRQSISC